MHKKNTSVRGQTKVYFRKHVRIFNNEKGWSFILFGAIISILVCAVVGEKMFETYDDTKSGFFAIICAAIWIGIFNSIQLICKERDILQYEYRSGLKITAYILSHFRFQALMCLVQSAILVIAYCVWVDYPTEGVLFPWAIVEYSIMIYLLMVASDAMGLFISSLVGSPKTVMTTMSFILILQLIMSGVLFTLSGWSEYIFYITVSKWGMAAMDSIAGLNDTEAFPQKVQKYIDKQVAEQGGQLFTLERVSEDAYEATGEHLVQICGILLLFIVVLLVGSIIRLRFIDHEK
ncbi:MAG: ABC transporter permease [Ruminococcus sp.]|nr:ABC transporter permease [Ruminococcus sp.]